MQLDPNSVPSWNDLQDFLDSENATEEERDLARRRWWAEVNQQPDFQGLDTDSKVDIRNEVFNVKPGESTGDMILGGLAHVPAGLLAGAKDLTTAVASIAELPQEAATGEEDPYSKYPKKFFGDLEKKVLGSDIPPVTAGEKILEAPGKIAGGLGEFGVAASPILAAELLSGGTLSGVLAPVVGSMAAPYLASAATFALPAIEHAITEKTPVEEALPEVAKAAAFGGIMHLGNVGTSAVLNKVLGPLAMSARQAEKLKNVQSWSEYMGKGKVDVPLSAYLEKEPTPEMIAKASDNPYLQPNLLAYQAAKKDLALRTLITKGVTAGVTGALFAGDSLLRGAPADDVVENGLTGAVLGGFFAEPGLSVKELPETRDTAEKNVRALLQWHAVRTQSGTDVNDAIENANATYDISDAMAQSVNGTGFDEALPAWVGASAGVRVAPENNLPPGIEAEGGTVRGWERPGRLSLDVIRADAENRLLDLYGETVQTDSGPKVVLSPAGRAAQERVHQVFGDTDFVESHLPVTRNGRVNEIGGVLLKDKPLLNADGTPMTDKDGNPQFETRRTPLTQLHEIQHLAFDNMEPEIQDSILRTIDPSIGEIQRDLNNPRTIINPTDDIKNAKEQWVVDNMRHIRSNQPPTAKIAPAWLRFQEILKATDSLANPGDLEGENTQLRDTLKRMYSGENISDIVKVEPYVKPLPQLEAPKPIEGGIVPVTGERGITPVREKKPDVWFTQTLGRGGVGLPSDVVNDVFKTASAIADIRGSTPSDILRESGVVPRGVEEIRKPGIRPVSEIDSDIKSIKDKYAFKVSPQEQAFVDNIEETLRKIRDDMPKDSTTGEVLRKASSKSTPAGDRISQQVIRTYLDYIKKKTTAVTMDEADSSRLEHLSKERILSSAAEKEPKIAARVKRSAVAGSRGNIAMEITRDSTATDVKREMAKALLRKMTPDEYKLASRTIRSGPISGKIDEAKLNRFADAAVEFAETGTVKPRDVSDSTAGILNFLFNKMKSSSMESEAARTESRTKTLFDRVAETVKPTIISHSEEAGAFGRDEIEESARLWKELGTKSPFFRRWFNGSVVNDENGNPMIVYHGTTAKLPFSVFRVNSDLGAHFSTSPYVAGHFSLRRLPEGEKGRLYPVFLMIKNPLRLRDTGVDWDRGDVVDQLYELNIIDSRKKRSLIEAIRTRNSPGEKIVQAIKDSGHDGVVYLNRVEIFRKGDDLTHLPPDIHKRLDGHPLSLLSDAEFKRLMPEASDAYIAFDPEQIKSVNNRGTFYNVPDIMHDVVAKNVAPRIVSAYGEIGKTRSAQAVAVASSGQREAQPQDISETPRGLPYGLTMKTLFLNLNKLEKGATQVITYLHREEMPRAARTYATFATQADNARAAGNMAEAQRCDAIAAKQLDDLKLALNSYCLAASISGRSLGLFTKRSIERAAGSYKVRKGLRMEDEMARAQAEAQVLGSDSSVQYDRFFDDVSTKRLAEIIRTEPGRAVEHFRNLTEALKQMGLGGTDNIQIEATISSKAFELWYNSLLSGMAGPVACSGNILSNMWRASVKRPMAVAVDKLVSKLTGSPRTYSDREFYAQWQAMPIAFFQALNVMGQTLTAEGGSRVSMVGRRLEERTSKQLERLSKGMYKNVAGAAEPFRLNDPGAFIKDRESTIARSFSYLPEGGAKIPGPGENANPVDLLLQGAGGIIPRNTAEGWFNPEGLPLGETARSILRRETLPSIGLPGTIVRLPTIGLVGVDRASSVFTTVLEGRSMSWKLAEDAAKRGEISETQIREHADHIFSRWWEYPEIVDSAKMAASIENQQRSVGRAGKAILNLRQIPLAGPILKVIFPFPRTPINLTKYALGMSPAGFVNGLRKLAKQELAFRGSSMEEYNAWKEQGGDNERFQNYSDYIERVYGKDLKPSTARRLALEDIGQSIVAAGLGLVLYGIAKQGLMTGNGPTDPRENSNWRAAGYEPMSFRFSKGGPWIGFRRLEPFSTVMAMAGDIAAMGDNPDKLGELANIIKTNFTNKTFLTGMEQSTLAWSDPKRFGQQYINMMAGSIVPSALSYMARSIDPVSRQTQGIGQYIQSRIPFASMSLPQRMTPTGEVAQKTEGSGYLQSVGVVPGVTMVTRTADPLAEEMHRLRFETGMPAALPSLKELRNQYKKASEDESGRSLQRLTGGPREDYPSKDDYQVYIDEYRKTSENLRNLISSPMWDSIPDEKKAEIISRQYQRAKQRARAMVKLRT